VNANFLSLNWSAPEGNEGRSFDSEADALTTSETFGKHRMPQIRYSWTMDRSTGGSSIQMVTLLGKVAWHIKSTGFTKIRKRSNILWRFF